MHEVSIKEKLESKKTVSRRAQALDRPASRLSKTSGGANSSAASDNEDSISVNEYACTSCSKVFSKGNGLLTIFHEQELQKLCIRRQ